MLVFVTHNYLTKAAGEGPRGLDDNVYAEFSYSLNRRGVDNMIAVVMEAACRDTSQWQGVVGLRLGSCLYIDCSADVGSEAFRAGVAALVAEVRRRTGKEAPSAEGTTDEASATVQIELQKA